MTAIVALFDGCRTFLAADRVALIPDTSHGYVISREAEKIVAVGDWTLATTGSAGLGDLLSRREGLAEAANAPDFFGRLPRIFAEIGFRPQRGDEDSAQGEFASFPCEFFLCRKGECWMVFPNLVPLPVPVGRPVAIGSGCTVAAAAAWAILKFGADPGRAVAGGIAAASEYLTGIGSEATVCVIGDAA